MGRKLTSPSHVYVFDLSRRHLGVVTAVKHSSGTPVSAPLESWTCAATSDVEALGLAQVAAIQEWPPVRGRLPNDFIVSFRDSLEPAATQRSVGDNAAPFPDACVDGD